MRLKALGLAIAGVIIGMTVPAQASVKYVYAASRNGAGFTYISSEYVPNGSGYMESCTPLAGDVSCGAVYMASYSDSDYVRMLSVAPTPYDPSPDTSSILHYYSEYFPLGSFSTLGIHTGERGGSLTVTSDAPSGAPEPATWAMLILGMAGVGATLRRTRAALA